MSLRLPSLLRAIAPFALSAAFLVSPFHAAKADGIAPLPIQVGKASYYAHSFKGHRTASGCVYNENMLTGASSVLPLGTRVKVTNLANGRSVNLTINDRGSMHGRVLDMTPRAADALNMRRAGVAQVEIRPLSAEDDIEEASLD